MTNDKSEMTNPDTFLSISTNDRPIPQPATALLDVHSLYQSLRVEIGKAVFGQDEVIEFSLAALLSSGHVLLEGPPGVAKTLLVKSIAAAMSLPFTRIQMTPDLLPNDITGSTIYREDNHQFEFQPGPVFTHFLLADEINRASARTQSALLEAMQELAVTYAGVTRPLPEPFITFATQNPIEHEGTYPLPLAQLDRFMFKVQVGYPDPEHEQRILREHHATGATGQPAQMGVQPVVTAADILAARRVIRDTLVREEVIGYIQRLMQATRQIEALAVGGSPRCGLMLLMGAKSLARFAGRDFVTPDDVKAAFLPALRHRVVLSPSSELEGIAADEILGHILDVVEVPR
jgi:MoxR-like ATPase